MFKLFIIWLFSFSGVHDFHTSLTEANYNIKTGSLEVSIRVFTDDLEKALKPLNNNKTLSLQSGIPKEAEALLNTYFRKNFAFLNSQKEVKLGQYIGAEKEADATWIFLEFENCQNLASFTLLNSIFTELFSDQTNLINITSGQKKKSLVLNVKDKTAVWPL